MAKSKAAKEDPAEQCRAFLTNRAEKYDKMQKSALIVTTYSIEAAPYIEALAAFDTGGMDAVRALVEKWRRLGIRSETIADIVQYLSGGTVYLPADPLDLASFWETKARMQYKAMMEDHKHLRQIEAEGDRRNREKKQKEEREILAQKTGIPVDELEKLAEAKPAG